MGVYIKNMEMPKAGNWKTIRIYYDGTCAEPNWQGDCKVIKGCEAIPVPNHGNLIDRDALMEHECYVPVVRCKDCKHRPVDPEGKNYGQDLVFPDDYKCPCRCEDPWYSWIPDDEWFCANGERRTDEQT